MKKRSKTFNWRKDGEKHSLSIKRLKGWTFVLIDDFDGESFEAIRIPTRMISEICKTLIEYAAGTQ
jgi:hypothetical protein